MRAEQALEYARPRLEMKNFPYKGKQTVVALFRKYKGRWYSKEEDETVTVPRAYEALEDFNRRYGTNLRAMCPEVAERILTDGTANWRYVRECSPFLVDAIVGYERPGKAFGKELVFEPDRNGKRAIMLTHDYEGAENAVIVVRGMTAKDFDTRGRETILNVPKERMKLMPGFPQKSEWRRLESGVTIPAGAAVDCSLEYAREIKRRNSSFIGAAVRDVGMEEPRRTISLCYPLHHRLGMLVEVPSYDIEKLGATVGQGVDPEDFGRDNVRHIGVRDSAESLLLAMRARYTDMSQIKAHLPTSVRDVLEKAMAENVKAQLDNIVRIMRAHLPKAQRNKFDKVVEGVLGKEGED